MFHGPFWTKNSIVTVILQFDFIWTKTKCEMQVIVRSKISKKVKFTKFIFLKKYMFLMQNLLINPIVPLVFPQRARTLKKRIWRYDVIIGHYGEDKNISFGGIELKLCTLVEDRYFYNTYSCFFFENFQNFDFVVIFKVICFWNFGDRKTQFQKSGIAIL